MKYGDKTEMIKNKIEEEKNLVLLMIKIFCKSNHKNNNRNNLCEECIELYDYTSGRIDRCRFMETKTFCSVCPSHCYKNDMRERIREVMIFSSKRMIFYHPILTLKHIFIILKSKRKLNSTNLKNKM